jgi:hypothetical protein
LDLISASTCSILSGSIICISSDPCETAALDKKNIGVILIGANQIK